MEDRIKSNFARQGFMRTLGAELVAVEKGKVIITCPFTEQLRQQNGFFHAGVLTSIGDSACGYAAYTLMPDHSDVLTVEFKINLFKPANTERVYALGSVVHFGKTLVIAEALIKDHKEEVVLAKMTATLICMHNNIQSIAN